MKKAVQWIVVLLCMVTSPMFAQTAEENSILKVAKAETESYMKGDSITWRALFIHNEKLNSYYAGKGFYMPTVGWAAFSKQLLGWMKERGKPSRYNIVTISNPILNVTDKMATAIYDQKLTSNKTDTLKPSLTREYRTFIKENDQWKIAAVGTYDSVSFTSTRPQDVEDQINILGYNFLYAKKFDQAIEMFKFNVKMYPTAWNTYDSLGEAYAATGNTELAILNYEKSVQLNPKNDNGKKVLQKLKNEASTATSTVKKSKE